MQGGFWGNWVNYLLNAIYFGGPGAAVGPRVDCLRANVGLSWTKRQLAWLLGSGMINGSHLVNDGLDAQTFQLLRPLNSWPSHARVPAG